MVEGCPSRHRLARAAPRARGAIGNDHAQRPDSARGAMLAGIAGHHRLPFGLSPRITSRRMDRRKPRRKDMLTGESHRKEYNDAHRHPVPVGAYDTSAPAMTRCPLT